MNKAIENRKEANGFVFYEVDGMISLFNSASTCSQITSLQKHRPEAKQWQLQGFVNLFHPSNSCDRVGMRKAFDSYSQLSLALTAAFPEKEFIITIGDDGHSVSFYEYQVGAPVDDDPLNEAMPEKQWCNLCSTRCSFHLRSTKDAEFPKTIWGDCGECGSEILVGGRVIRIRVPICHVNGRT